MNSAQAAMPLILIADDAAFSRMTMIGALTEEGYEMIIQASDGEEAVALFKEHKPELVILDISMPNLTGMEALEQIREYDENARVIIISSQGQEAKIKSAVGLGAIDYLVKPFKPERLVQAVGNILSQ